MVSIDNKSVHVRVMALLQAIVWTIDEEIHLRFYITRCQWGEYVCHHKLVMDGPQQWHF